MADLLQLPEKQYSIIYADPPWAYRQCGAAGEVGIMQLNPGPGGSYHAELTAATGRDPTTQENIPRKQRRTALLLHTCTAWMAEEGQKSREKAVEKIHEINYGKLGGISHDCKRICAANTSGSAWRTLWWRYARMPI